MDLRREKRKENRILGFALTISGICASAVIALIVSVMIKPDITSDYINAGGLDKRAETVAAGFEGLSNEKNEKDEFSFEINGDIVFENCESNGKILLKNPMKNRYLMSLEIVVKDKAFLSTGNIAPGQMIKEAKPDIEISKGEYKAVAMISAVDSQNGNIIDTVMQNISVTIKN